RPVRLRRRGVRARQPASPAASDHRRRRGLPRGGQRLPGTGRPELLGARMSLVNKAGGATVDYVDQRTGIVGVAAGSRLVHLRKLFPDHWSFMLGEIALYSFIVLLLTGV